MIIRYLLLSRFAEARAPSPEQAMKQPFRTESDPSNVDG